MAIGTLELLSSAPTTAIAQLIYAQSLSGAGTRAHGGMEGRFAPAGTGAVYLSATDSGASKEVTAQMARLGGVGQISTDKYPRVVYSVAVDLKKNLNLATLGLFPGSGSRKSGMSR